jgi:voltage-gated potassium channel
MIWFFVVLWGFIRSMRGALDDQRFRTQLILVVVLLTTGSIFYWRVEHWSLFNSLYFSVITLCTIGYGDFTPQTTLGRGFTIIYAFLGIGLILSFVDFFTDQSITSRTERPRLRRRAHAVARDVEQEAEKEL